ncbi:MAG TPA: DUF177 domain-containing protein [Pseudolabrys sp.]|nr:DUF177 domain-containing protein [Pseudolabrys sp.]
MTTSTERPWSFPVPIAELPETGQHFDVAADEPARAAIAQLAGLRALPELAASFDIIRQGNAVHVSGNVRARVGQTCVVTLEPIENTVREDVDLVFAPGGGAAAEAGKSHGHTLADDEEAPEPLLGDTVDLGAVATEFLMLGIDPYPRKEGVEFAATTAGDAAAAHPFAALAALKKGSTGESK